MTSDRDRRTGPGGRPGRPAARRGRPRPDGSPDGARTERFRPDGRRSPRDGPGGGSGTPPPGREGAQGTGTRRRLSQQDYDGPPLPDSITGRELDRRVRDQLGGLPERLAIRVARHLVAAGQLLDEDLETAFGHARAARARAARVPAVREAYAELAYLTQRWEEALRELRTVRRMTGAPDSLPLIADCERALGRPERAIALGRDPGVERLDPAGRAEMSIVVAGARRDRGQLDAALGVLEAADLRSRSRAEWVARLRYAYADALQAAGRTDAALEWFHRAAGVDAQGSTDALARAEALQAGPDR